MKKEVYFNNIRKEILNNLNQCESEILIAVAWFTDKLIIDKLNSLIKQGIKVEIIIYDNHVNKKELFKELYYSNAKIYLSKKLMHNKFCIIDKKTIINGSYNWTINATSNDENIEITYNDFDYARKFIIQFNEIIKSCISIDNFFEYSLSSIEKLYNQFKIEYAAWDKYSFPYFINGTKFNVTEINNKSKIIKYFYFVKNQNEAEKIIWYKYILESTYSLNEILDIQKESIQLPIKFNFVHVNNWDSNAVAVFNQHNNIVEKHDNSYNSLNKRHYIYSIDNDGKPVSEQFLFTYKLNDGLFINHMDKPYFITNKLNKYFIKHSVARILMNSSLLCINDSLYYGIINFENNLIVPFKFNNYVREHIETINDIRIDKIEYIDFIEYPILIKTQSRIFTPNYRNSNKLLEHIVHRYSLVDFNLIYKNKIAGKTNENDQVFFFLSESDYKYEIFYNAIKSLLEEQYKVSINAFERLKQDYQEGQNNSFYLTIKNFKKQQDLEKYLLEEKNKTVEKKDACYVATMVYQDYDHPKVLVLRKFRDNILNKSRVGKKLIFIYYAFSPKFVKIAKNSYFLTLISKILINITLIIIKSTQLAVNILTRLI